jgi:hypothetical protein
MNRIVLRSLMSQQRDTHRAHCQSHWRVPEPDRQRKEVNHVIHVRTKHMGAKDAVILLLDQHLVIRVLVADAARRVPVRSILMLGVNFKP